MCARPQDAGKGRTRPGYASVPEVTHFFHRQPRLLLLISVYIGSRIRTASCWVNRQFSLRTEPEVMDRLFLERVVQDLRVSG